MATVKTLKDYKHLTGVTKKNKVKINAIKTRLEVELRKKNSALGIALSSLSEEQKSLLIKALVTKEGSTLKTMIAELLIKSNIKINTQYLDKITEHVNYKSSLKDFWLNSTVSLIIAQMLKSKTGSVRANARNTRILQNAMQLIPESIIHIAAKVHLCEEIDFSATAGLTDISYTESLPLLHKNRFSGIISIKEYTTAIQADYLDFSEYIMLTLGVIQGIAQQKNIDLNKNLNQIRQYYLLTHYEKAITSLNELAKENEIFLGETLVNLIDKRAKQIIEVDLAKNYSRRFFENRLSQLQLGCHSENDWKSIDKIAFRILRKHVNSPEEAEDAVLNIAELSFEGAKERVDTLKEESKLYLYKDRLDKDLFIEKNLEKSGIVSKVDVYSKNQGMLTSNAPNFYDELSKIPLRNRLVDIAATYGEDVGGYSYSHPRSAFAASISGHCFKIVATLEQYMKKYKKDPNLEQDITQFLKQTISSYISKGYHGYFEMVDVLNEPHIQKVFTDCNVHLNLEWLSALAEQAAKDTQEYTKTLCLKRTVGAALLKSNLLKPPKATPSIQSESEIVLNKKNNN